MPGRGSYRRARADDGLRDQGSTFTDAFRPEASRNLGGRLQGGRSYVLKAPPRLGSQEVVTPPRRFVAAAPLSACLCWGGSGRLVA